MNAPCLPRPRVIAATGATEIVAAASAGQVIEVGRSGSVLPHPAS